jgi:nucleoside-diphosphate-sugar epimerase
VEEAISGLADQDFTPTSLRAATVYGVSPRLRGDVVVNNLVGSALTRGEVRLLSDGRSWRPLLHVEDLCHAFISVLEAPTGQVHDRAFNVAPAGENYLIRDVAEVVAEQVAGCSVTYAEGEGGPDPRSYKVDGAMLTSMVPSFVPRWTVPEGVAQLVTALENQGLTEEEFFGPRFLRLEQLRSLIRSGRVTEDLYWRKPGAETRDPSEWNKTGWADAPAPGR